MTRPPDWNPKAAEVLQDPCAAYDRMRRDCPVAYSEMLGWSVFRHQDIVRVLEDHETFSSQVSKHVSVPNGLDPPEHTKFRSIVEPLFRPAAMSAFEPKCRAIAEQLMNDLWHGFDNSPSHEVEFIADFAQPFAVRAQCESLGWHAEMYEPLRLWTRKNQQATFAQDRPAMAQVAQEFEGYTADLLRDRRDNAATNEHDVIARLLAARVDGRPLTDEELVSILRNWTVGEIGTISAAVGILAQFLANDLQVQTILRADKAKIPGAIEEILRVHGPLVANRRVTTCPVEIGGRTIEAGEPLSLNWISANRDERVFEDPYTVRLERDQSQNLLYGVGVHACPGAPLARLEMRVAVEELLARTQRIVCNPIMSPQLLIFPASGFATLPLIVS